MSPAPAKRPLRPRPVVFVWTGDHMVPLPRFQRLCDQQFAVHEEYPLAIVENRNMASHNAYFAQLSTAFDNLAEEHAKRFLDAEALRSWALVQTGYCTEVDHVADGPAEARKLALTMRRYSPYAIIKVSGNVVKVFEPLSQSVAAMKKQPFEDSKRAVLELVASMARTTPAELKKNAGRSA